ncbi:hypothetical protein GQ53DRAFT_7917 [Thozetella sp. PMI_491]|nr:hypothetical protein GQ53DRAFT_7917 [Thozetella sp. PMI_491]
MTQLTDTSTFSSLSYTLPSLQHTVTVHLPGSSMVSSMLSPTSTHRIMEIPRNSKWSPGSHWHEAYVEHIKVLQGRAKVYINGACRELAAGNEATFERFDIHDFCRSEFDDGETLLIEEWTDNEDGTKIVFFYNAFSIVHDMDKFGGLLWAFLRFFYLCSYRDNFIAFCPPAVPRWMQGIVTGAVFGLVRLVGYVAGWSTWYTSYTPEQFRSLANTGSGLKKRA